MRRKLILCELTLFQGKVNPTQCEALTMVCAQVRFNVLFLFTLIVTVWRMP